MKVFSAKTKNSFTQRYYFEIGEVDFSQNFRKKIKFSSFSRPSWEEEKLITVWWWLPMIFHVCDGRDASFPEISSLLHVWENFVQSFPRKPKEYK